MVELAHSHFISLPLRNFIGVYVVHTRYRASPLRMFRTSQTWARVEAQ